MGTSAVAQQPSHYTIGERELEGEHIYDIHQSRTGDYWIATNSGLFKYDGYTFERQNCKDILTPSLFDLTEDEAGNIFCFNLAGQIFKVSEGLCQPYFTLSDTLLSSLIDIEIDDQGQLVIMSARAVIIDKERNATILPLTGNPGSTYLGTLTKMPDGSIMGSPFLNGSMLVWKNGKQDVLKINQLATPEFDPFQVINFNDRILFNSVGKAKLLELKNDGLIPRTPECVTDKNQRKSVYQTEDELWIIGGTTGAQRLNANLSCIDQEPIFPNTFISAITEDQEKNTLLGTFGNGIIVIPDGSATDLTQLPKDEKAASIASDSKGRLYIGTQTGKIFRLNAGGLELFRNGQKRTVENLFYLKDGTLIFTDSDGVQIDTETKEEQAVLIGAVKDIFPLHNGDHLIASNHGGIILKSSSSRVEMIPELSLRLHGIGEDKNTETIYACSSKGLILLNNGVSEFAKLNGKEIIGRDVATDGTNVFVATDASGILVFENDSIIDNWNMNSGLISDRVRHIKLINNQLYAATDRGIQIISTEGEIIKTIGRSEGLYAENIKQFEVVNNQLWVVHNQGVQSIPLEFENQQSFQPTISLSSIYVNDSAFSTTTTNFSSEQTKFRFELRSRTLKYQREIKYSIRLLGSEKEWQENEFADNVIEYRSLAPGNYTFEAKSIFREKESEPIKYSFSIATPFYKTWWFILSCALFIIILITLIFQRRLRIQQKRAQQINELNASKLTAIQSQMNPHFIFNALNSIQDLVLKGDIDNSYTFITKFANLVRRTLNYSDKDLIDFDEEIKLIELYLSLEKLRFKTDFTYSINSTGIEGIQIPPMLIQPFIENALVHGLLHKEGEKRIEIDFKLTDILECRISDNGIGRKKSREIQERKKREHESFSVTAIKKRFEILETHLGGTLGFEYEDGKEGGTSVILRIPVVRSF